MMIITIDGGGTKLGTAAFSGHMLMGSEPGGGEPIRIAQWYVDDGHVSAT
jgi:hypothetical protein